MVHEDQGVLEYLPGAVEAALTEAADDLLGPAQQADGRHLEVDRLSGHGEVAGPGGSKERQRRPWEGRRKGDGCVMNIAIPLNHILMANSPPGEPDK